MSSFWHYADKSCGVCYVMCWVCLDVYRIVSDVSFMIGPELSQVTCVTGYTFTMFVIIICFVCVSYVFCIMHYAFCVQFYAIYALRYVLCVIRALFCYLMSAVRFLHAVLCVLRYALCVLRSAFVVVCCCLDICCVITHRRNNVYEHLYFCLIQTKNNILL